jgi:glycogen synthase
VLGGMTEVWGCRRADEVIVLTERLAARLRAEGQPEDRVHVIPSGVVSADFSDQLPDPFPDIPHPRLVFVGRLNRQKGVRVLAEAVGSMREPGHVLFVGDGQERRAVERIIARSPARDRVHLLGFRPHHEIAAILRHTNVFVLPSMYEELGSVLIEAMQAGAPIVASDTGGIPAAVGDAGMLVPPGDPAALAAAMDRLLAEPETRAQLAAAGRDRARAYDWPVLAGRVLQVYERAIEARLTQRGRERVPASA